MGKIIIQFPKLARRTFSQVIHILFVEKFFYKKLAKARKKLFAPRCLFIGAKLKSAGGKRLKCGVCAASTRDILFPRNLLQNKKSPENEKFARSHATFGADF